MHTTGLITILLATAFSLSQQEVKAQSNTDQNGFNVNLSADPSDAFQNPNVILPQGIGGAPSILSSSDPNTMLIGSGFPVDPGVSSPNTSGIGSSIAEEDRQIIGPQVIDTVPLPVGKKYDSDVAEPGKPQ